MDYLIRKGEWFYFRVRVPKDLLAHFPTNEIKRSLKTTNKNLAKLAAKALSLKLEQTFFMIRNNMKFDPKLISKLATDFIEDGLKNDEEYRTYSEAIDITLLSKLQKAYEAVIEDLTEDLALNNLKSIEPKVDSLLKNKNISIDKTSKEYAALSREILKADRPHGLKGSLKAATS